MPGYGPPPSRYPRARKIGIVILAVLAAPVIFIAFLATFDRSR